MKKLVFCLLVMVLTCVGCTTESEPLKVGDFSYGAVESYYSVNTYGVMHSGFRNTQPTTVESAEQALELAKNECVIQYDSYVVSYDEETKMYCVCFYMKDADGGDQLIYMDSNGLTQLVVFGK